MPDAFEHDLPPRSGAQASTLEGLSEGLSAAADGEASAEELAQTCAQWSRSRSAQALWHDYHLIGELMRSDDALVEGKGPSFLAGFRRRLSEEPVVLAPYVPAQSVQGVVSVRTARVHHLGRLALVASLVATLSIWLHSVGPQPAATMASARGLSVATVTQRLARSNQTPSRSPAALVPAADQSAMAAGETRRQAGHGTAWGELASGDQAEVLVIRDAQLDRLLHAHQRALNAGGAWEAQGLVQRAVYGAP